MHSATELLLNPPPQALTRAPHPSLAAKLETEQTGNE